MPYCQGKRRVQIGELREIAKLRRNGATEQIRGETPERVTVNEREYSEIARDTIRRQIIG